MSTARKSRNQYGGVGGERNHLTFDNSKNGMLAFTRGRKSDLKPRLAEDRVTVRGYTLGFKTVGTRWL